MNSTTKRILQARTRALVAAKHACYHADALVKSFEDFFCPFCRDFDLFAYPPRPGGRNWWTIGCDSRKCNSCWRLEVDTYAEALSKIRKAQG